MLLQSAFLLLVVCLSFRFLILKAEAEAKQTELESIKATSLGLLHVRVAVADAG
jgi:hypothetical protein